MPGISDNPKSQDLINKLMDLRKDVLMFYKKHKSSNTDL